jgi:hypothetical protein
MARAVSLLDAVNAAAATHRGRLTWFESLDADAQAEMLAARRRWQEGGYTLKRLTVARLIVKAATDRGWKVCDHTRMAEWLAKKE